VHTHHFRLIKKLNLHFVNFTRCAHTHLKNTGINTREFWFGGLFFFWLTPAAMDRSDQINEVEVYGMLNDTAQEDEDQHLLPWERTQQRLQKTKTTLEDLNPVYANRLLQSCALQRIVDLRQDNDKLCVWVLRNPTLFKRPKRPKRRSSHQQDSSSTIVPLPLEYIGKDNQDTWTMSRTPVTLQHWFADQRKSLASSPLPGMHVDQGAIIALKQQAEANMPQPDHVYFADTESFYGFFAVDNDIAENSPGMLAINVYPNVVSPLLQHTTRRLTGEMQMCKTLVCDQQETSPQVVPIEELVSPDENIRMTWMEYPIRDGIALHALLTRPVWNGAQLVVYLDPDTRYFSAFWYIVFPPLGAEDQEVAIYHIASKVEDGYIWPTNIPTSLHTVSPEGSFMGSEIAQCPDIFAYPCIHTDIIGSALY
jgi:hypothetical protein